MAGMMVTWLQKIEKFSIPSALARSTVMALEGAVVSNPMAMNTTTSEAHDALPIYGRDDGDVVAEDREVLDPLGLGPQHGHGAGGGSGLEPDGHEHDHIGSTRRSSDLWPG